MPNKCPNSEINNLQNYDVEGPSVANRIILHTVLKPDTKGLYSETEENYGRQIF
jgi:hypothetical protein